MSYNPYILIPFISWLIAQLIKFVGRAFRGQIDLQLLYVSGGMPSAHAAVVMALATVALIVSGPGSGLFGVAAIFAGIVMYDALGVRRIAGEQAAAFNRLTTSLSRSNLGVPGEPAMRELKGHKPSEVAAGGTLGVVIAILFNTSKLRPQLAFLSSAAGRVELLALAAVFGLLVAGGFIYRYWLKQRHKGSSAAAKLASAVLLKTQVIGWPGLLLAFAGYQKASFLAWRIWPYSLLAVLLVWDAVLVNKYRTTLPTALAHEAERTRRERWLKPAKKRK